MEDVGPSDVDAIESRGGSKYRKSLFERVAYRTAEGYSCSIMLSDQACLSTLAAMQARHKLALSDKFNFASDSR